MEFQQYTQNIQHQIDELERFKKEREKHEIEKMELRKRELREMKKQEELQQQTKIEDDYQAQVGVWKKQESDGIPKSKQELSGTCKNRIGY